MFKHLVECVLSAVCSLYPLGLDFGGGNSILENFASETKVEIVDLSSLCNSQIWDELICVQPTHVKDYDFGICPTSLMHN